jgi:hypothetical protein
LLDVPANRRSDPRAHTQIVDHLPPGAVIRRRVYVSNDTPDRQHIEVYPAAATVGKGKFQVGEGHAANELTSWISVDPGSVDVEPGGKTPIQVTVRVPSTASTGERYAVVWASLATRRDPSSNVSRIDVVHRVGVRMYLHVGAGDEPPSSFTIGKVIPARDEHGRPSVTIEVNNTGGRALDLSGKVKLSDGPDGARAGPSDVGVTTLAPGESGTVTAQFPGDLADGPWKIEVNLASGMVKNAATGTVTFPKTGQRGKPSTLSTLGIAWTTVGASLAVGLVAITGLTITARRVRRKATKHRH